MAAFYTLQNSWFSDEYHRIGARIRPMDVGDLYLFNNRSAHLTTAVAGVVIPFAGDTTTESIYITDITITNGSATDTWVTIEDSAGNVYYEGFAQAKGGLTKQLGTPIMMPTGQPVKARCATAGADVVVSVQGYRGYSN